MDDYINKLKDNYGNCEGNNGCKECMFFDYENLKCDFEKEREDLYGKGYNDGYKAGEINDQYSHYSKGYRKGYRKAIEELLAELKKIDECQFDSYTLCLVEELADKLKGE